MDGLDDEENDQFFETMEEILSVSDSGSDSAENDTYIDSVNADVFRAKSKYEIWKREPGSIQERRQRFLREMGLDTDREFRDEVNSSHFELLCESKFSRESATASPLIEPECLGIGRLTENSGAVLRTVGCNPLISPSKPYSCRKPCSLNGSNTMAMHKKHCLSATFHDRTADVCEDSRKLEKPRDPVFSPVDSSGELFGKIKNLDSGKEFVVDELGQDGMWNKLREVGTGRQLTMEEFERTLGFSPIVQELMRRENTVERAANEEEDHDLDVSQRRKRSWLKTLKVVAQNMRGHNYSETNDESGKGSRRSSSFAEASLERPQRIKVHQYRKSCKELTALYMGQEIQAHKGSIWTMKFSLDGHYLASAGQDCVIHVREVIESGRKFGTDKSDGNISDSHFSVNSSSELIPLSIEGHAGKKKTGKIKGTRKNLNSDCILLPDKVFELSEKPLCSFEGHLDEVLDLSWSRSQYLLSSSRDKTVRLWRIGYKSCLKMFTHNNFVTCVQFNPVDDRYFISGSLDGKVRIWSIPDRQVVDWSDLREIITAACYTPDGQGGLVGSIKGSCRFYNTSGNKLQLESEVGVHSKKKKSSGKMITGFQFAPGDSQKVLITSTDSRARVFDGIELVHKYKGFRNACSQISASFTPNGKYVICASDNSNVYIWNYEMPNVPPARRKRSTWAHERFHSEGVSVAIPWFGMKLERPALSSDGMMPGQSQSPQFLLHGAMDAGWKNDFLSQACEGGQYSETGLRCVSHRSQLSGSHSLAYRVDGSEQDNLFCASAYISDSCQAAFTALSASPRNVDHLNSNHGFFSDNLSKGSATWPEEKLPLSCNLSPSNLAASKTHYNILKAGVGGAIQGQSTVAAAAAWGLVIVTAGLGGEIRSFQNYGLPVRL